tara:strand:- start:951 stop:2345 length:1395 start_codon:yes stop_codon:yes gene_type:complete
MRKYPIYNFLFFITVTLLIGAVKSHADNKNYDKCVEFSKIGLHEPAILNCKMALDSKLEENKNIIPLLYSLSNSYFSINRIDQADNYINQLLELENDPDGETLYLLGLINIRLNKYYEAIRSFESASKKGFESIELKRFYARALFKAKNERESNLVLTGLMYENEDDISSMVQLAENYIQLNDYTRAKNIIMQIKKSDAEYSYSYFLDYIISSSDKNFQKSLEDINKAIMRDRGNVRYLLEKAKLLTIEKKYNLAKYNIKKARDLSPDNIELMKLYENVLDIESMDAKESARNYIKLENYEKAISNYKKAIKLNPSDDQIYFERGQVYLKLKDYTNAETDLITALSMNASFQDKSIYLLLGKIYFLQQKYTESILMIDRELDLNPRNRIAILWQIRTLSKISDYEEAVIYANKLIKISPNEAEGYAILGDIKLYMGNLEESNQYHEKALKIDPNYNIASKKKIL